MPGHTLGHDGEATDETAGDDRLLYLDILRVLGNQRAAVTSALLEAHTADTAQHRRAALTVLHPRLRDMAAIANDALGSWPEHADGPR